MLSRQGDTCTSAIQRGASALGATCRAGSGTVQTLPPAAGRDVPGRGGGAHLGQAGVAVADGEAVKVHDPAPRLHRPLLALLLCLLRCRRLLRRLQRLLHRQLCLQLWQRRLAAGLAAQLAGDRGKLIL